MKRILQGLLLLLVVGSLGHWAWNRIAERSDPPPQSLARSDVNMAAPAARQVVVTYFTTVYRCSSCLEIEALTKNTVEQHFAEYVVQGRLRFRALNLDRPENARFLHDYQLSFKTVVVSDQRNGTEVRWQRMDGVWQLRTRPQLFSDYLSGQIREYLETET
jgi:hypothetical protein